MNPESRRDFLARAARLGVVIALPGALLRAQDAAESRPESRPASRPAARNDGLDALLKRARAENKAAIVFAFPEDETRQEELVSLLSFALDMIGGSLAIDSRELFLCVLLGCYQRKEVLHHVTGARDSEDVFLLDGEGRREDGCRLTREELKYSADLVLRLRRLAFGENLERLRARAATTRSGLSSEELATYESLLEEEPRNRRRVADATALLPLVALDRAVGPADSKRSLDALVFFTAAKLGETEHGPFLPYGLDLVARSSNGCGSLHPKDEPVFVCGMASLRPASRRFVGMICSESH